LLTGLHPFTPALDFNLYNKHYFLSFQLTSSSVFFQVSCRVAVLYQVLVH